MPVFPPPGLGLPLARAKFRLETNVSDRWKMKIFTNEKNPAVLKLLVSSIVAKVDVACQNVNFGGKDVTILFY